MTPPIQSTAAAGTAGQAVSPAVSIATSSVPAGEAPAPETVAVTVLPARYNAAEDLLARHLDAGRGGKLAYIDDTATLTFSELDDRCRRFAGALHRAGFRREERVLLCALDTIDFPTVFLGCLLAGVVPVAVNTLLTVDDYAYMLEHSGARAVLVSAPLLGTMQAAIDKAGLAPDVIVAAPGAQPMAGMPGASVASMVADADPAAKAAATGPDDMAFWLYSSGSTGRPKGTVHTHGNLFHTADLYARRVLDIREDDVVFSAAKLFFAYGLGNALTFPLSVGATTVLMAERPTPQAVFQRLTRHRPTVFCGVPTLFAGMLAAADLPPRADVAMRVCTSAGEALPRDIGDRFLAHFGCDILDGIGSTEMLHIFLSNRPGEVRYGTTGRPVPGYELKLLDEQGEPCPAGEIGDLYIKGPSAALMYWCNRDKSRDTFVGAWTRSGDKYVRDADGYYTYAGRSDDMLKVGGIYVSPFEVEAALARHPAVLEAAVIGVADADDLIKPKAFVVLRPGQHWHDGMAAELQAFVKAKLAPYKYPRQIECVEELPKTATGKIQRFRLRQREEAARLS
ncbi:MULTISPECIES: benzoate-CoA ligase family protein [unclassified Cupriavidus]|uniref:benzoate-CoA ligase family protein n=1 Tax=unclassified Cupriavidus TaxID=2640874 RepID=UPI001C002B69|nr:MULTISPECIES: benzoate-CoA ligase family protein [unclassified Cupriavidus]MCA3189438.1 benzoate-CoA ligase family protein [Cupriavidus sp.]MCA3195518.1 benzoate-CoA ligase family protein [Cupriavidus sp.]MCA3201073.1 benzoate-CoA ligase family protein [Cupriavidus sp.]MCA3210465.1 benzoate-CoA ligase family protein [Cupriavidus sp.]QWE95527.1 benzoate-CoA ligase family protein [Cupriavidus sp. EM10]